MDPDRRPASQGDADLDGFQERADPQARGGRALPRPSRRARLATRRPPRGGPRRRHRRPARSWPGSRRRRLHHLRRPRRAPRQRLLRQRTVRAPATPAAQGPRLDRLDQRATDPRHGPRTCRHDRRGSPMLTISQLAAYAGVTVKAVRHYHAKGLLPEPERDHSGYRRYNARDVAELIKIRTLAEAGVPLARVRELLAADEEEFAAAVADIDRRLRKEIRERQRHRERIAKLAAGDNLALPPEAVAYLDRLRGLGVSERMIGGERDAWILVAAELPEHMATFMEMKE